jgi:AraC family transcriptional regulator
MPAPSPAVLASPNLRGVALREIVYRQGVIPRHTHDTAGFCLVLDGVYEERYARTTLACRARTVTFSPAGEEHANVFGSAAHCLTIDLAPAWLERMESGAARFREPFGMQGGALAWIGERLLRELHDDADDDGAALIIEGLLLEMLGQASRDSARAPSTNGSAALRRVRELLHAHYREPLSLADLAQATGRHPVYLATAFRRTYGETVGDCIRRLRIEHASRALTQSDAALADVALDAGFANQSHFTRAFKRATGTTPAEYRRLNPRQRTFVADKTPPR